MTEKRGLSSLAALAIARAQKRLAEESEDPDLALNAVKLERRLLYGEMGFVVVGGL